MPLRTDAELGAVRARLGPYLDAALERAAAQAQRLHAEQVAIEHLLLTLLEDEDSALNRLIEHAFADTETLLADVLAIAPGILVVGSGATLPFSPRAIAAVRRARSGAARRAATSVETADLFLEAARELEPAAWQSLGQAGLVLAAWEAILPAAVGEIPAGPPVNEEGHLFHYFSQGARRALSAAGRAARRVGERAIAPAHLLSAALEVDQTLASRVGLSAGRAALLLRAHGPDPTTTGSEPISPDPELSAFLTALPPGAGSLDVLGSLFERPQSEQAQIFSRQRVGLALLERARAELADPPTLDRTGEQGL